MHHAGCIENGLDNEEIAGVTDRSKNRSRLANSGVANLIGVIDSAPKDPSIDTIKDSRENYS